MKTFLVSQQSLITEYNPPTLTQTRVIEAETIEEAAARFAKCFGCDRKIIVVEARSFWVEPQVKEYHK